MDIIAEQPIEEMNLVEIRSHDAPKPVVQQSNKQAEKREVVQ